MPIVPNFTITQTPGSPSVVTATNTATGSDVAVTQLRIYLAKYDGSYFVPTGTTTDYVAWALASASINIPELDKDYAFLITVQWLNVSNAVLYTKSEVFGLTGYGEDFDYQLTQMLTVNPNNFNDNDFFNTKMDLRNYLDSGDNAISRASDRYSAQMCYDKATDLRIKSAYNFNSNA